MRKILISVIAAMLAMGVCAQPGREQTRSTYSLVDEVRTELKLDHSQFEKVYSAYDKYNKTVNGNVENTTGVPGPPPGGMRGNGPGKGPGPGFGGSRGQGRPSAGDAPPPHPGAGGGVKKPLTAAEVQKMEKTRAKAEEKLCAAMKKIFKKNPDLYSRWLSIRQGQLRETHPMGAPQNFN